MNVGGLHRLVHVDPGGDDRLVPAHVQAQLRPAGGLRGPVQGMRQHVVVGQHAFGGEVDVAAAGLGGENRVVGLAVDHLAGERRAQAVGAGEVRGADVGVLVDQLAGGVAGHHGVGSWCPRRRRR